MGKIKNSFESNPFLKVFSITLIVIILISLGLYLWFVAFQEPVEEIEDISEEDPQALMLLIEFEDTVGVNNFVFEMYERQIPGLLMVSAGYVEENCEFVRELQNYNIEIAGVAPQEPFWDMEYDRQFEIMNDTKERIEMCTGEVVRIIGSRYFAYDENTLRAADDLGIDFVFGRGVTGSKATVFKAEEYNARIFSVSNVTSEKWGTGSLCDYSYWAREGTPEDFKNEIYNAFERYSKVSPVSHTYLGGSIQRWNEVYMDMFDNIKIDWVTLDLFGSVDIYAPFNEIPDNREVLYDTPQPLIPLDQEISLDNPCAVVELDSKEENTDLEVSQDLVIFHNNMGPMCLELLNFLKDNDMEYTEYLTTESSFSENLTVYKSEYNNESEGASTSFGFYPMIFYKGRAFSGFNDEIASILLSL